VIAVAGFVLCLIIVGAIVVCLKQRSSKEQSSTQDSTTVYGTETQQTQTTYANIPRADNTSEYGSLQLAPKDNCKHISVVFLPKDLPKVDIHF
jgi:hypothetical protein